MQYFFRLIAYFLGIISLVVLHLSVSYLLPHPFAKINVIFIFLSLFLLLKQSGLVIWLACLLHIFIELYTATPFGIVLFSATISVLLGYWLYQSLFTNRSWYVAITLSSFLLIFYRFLYTTILFLSQKIFGIQNFSISSLPSIFFWELLLSSLIVALIYFILSKFIKNLNQKIIYS